MELSSGFHGVDYLYLFPAGVAVALLLGGRFGTLRAGVSVLGGVLAVLVAHALASGPTGGSSPLFESALGWYLTLLGGGALIAVGGLRLLQRAIHSARIGRMLGA